MWQAKDPMRVLLVEISLLLRRSPERGERCERCYCLARDAGQVMVREVKRRMGDFTCLIARKG